MSSEIKSITITGDANTLIGGTKRRRGVTRKRKALQIGGISREDNLEQTQIITPTSTTTGGQMTNVPPPPVIGGSEPKIKVKIAPKRQTHRIVLVKKHTADKHIVKPQRKHTIKRISITTDKIHNKLKKANTTRKAAQNMPIDDIKKHLLQKKIIKGGSNAPPELLRKMYEDSMIVANSSL
jgi:hypothetical protein